MTYSEKLKAVVNVLKTRFNNLTAVELIDIASRILDAISETNKDQESNKE